jgi:hypothetical protein
MSCRIKLYEISPTSPPAPGNVKSSTVLLVAVDQESLTNCCPVQTNRRFIGGGYGADLQFTLASFVYQVAIADTALIYAGATVSNLNGATPGDLDAVLFHVPSSGVGTVATGCTAGQMRGAVSRHPSWSPDEKQAVLSIMNALGSLRGTVAPRSWTSSFWRIVASTRGSFEL